MEPQANDGDKRYRPRPYLVAAFGGRSWEFVRWGHSPEGVPSRSGKTLKNYVVLRDRTTGETAIAGAGEATVYAGVQLPTRGSRT